MNLQIMPATPVLRLKADCSGYDLCREGEHRANLVIGNVSIAFDGRNQFDGRSGFVGEVIELSEYNDDPVHVHGSSVSDSSKPPGHDDSAVLLLRALATDLGYRIESL